MGSDIFISYRREDAASDAGRLHSSLIQEFGEHRVFMDTAAIEPAANWPRYIEQELVSCRVVIVAIGPGWLRAADEWGQRRIDNHDDWIRRELEFALRHQKEILPILFRGAAMPPAGKLPGEIGDLTDRQAVHVRASYWNHDLQLVVKKLHEILGTETHRASPRPARRKGREPPYVSQRQPTSDRQQTNRARAVPNKETLYCSFCGKSQHDVRKLVAGPSDVMICDECSDLCMYIIDESDSSKRVQDVSELCRISVEAQSDKLSNERRAKLRDRMQILAGRIRSTRRARENDLVAGARLVKVIGVGNFASVWLGRRLVDEQKRKEEEQYELVDGERETVAVKIFDQDKLAIGLMLWRFQRGIRAMTHLSGLGDVVPNSIVRLIDVSSDTLSFSMQYLPGGDLERIQHLGWSRRKKLSVFREIASAVEFGHRHGIVHRDIKPANIVLDERNRAVLTDFDIADLRFAATQSMRSTGLGTPQFAAPEQLVEQILIAHPTADIYSLGKLLFFMLEEKPPPLDSTDAQYLPQYLMEIEDATIRNAIERCIRYNPEDRFQSVAELVERLPG